MIRIAMASDLSGFPLKKAVAEHLKEKEGIEIIDYGIDSEEHPAAYFEQALKVAKAIQRGEADKGILVCGTGQGMAIVANKHKGIYAAVADGIFSAERGKIINDANVLTMGGWITAPFLGIQIVEAWLSMAFAQKMEFKKEFLSNAFKQVQKIEEENFNET